MAHCFVECVQRVPAWLGWDDACLGKVAFIGLQGRDSQKAREVCN